MTPTQFDRERGSRRSPLRVLLIAPLPPPKGGLATWTEIVLRATKDSSEVCVDLVDSSQRTEHLEQRGTVERIGIGVRQALFTFRATLNALKYFEADVAHLTTSGSLGLLRDLVLTGYLKLSKVPVVTQLHFGRLGQPGQVRTVESLLIRTLARSSDLVLALDSRTESALRKWVSADKVMNISNPVEVNDLAGPTNSNRDPIILCAGRVEEAKGVRELLQAWSRVEAEDWQLHIAGHCDQGFLNQIETSLTQMPSVHFHGEINRLALMSLMARSSVFVLPSHSEALPYAVLEAMGAAMPIVASSVGALPDVVTPENGILVPPRDPTALRVAIQEMVDDPSRRLGMGRASHAMVQSLFSVDVVVPQLVSTWFRVATAAAPEPRKFARRGTRKRAYDQS